MLKTLIIVATITLLVAAQASAQSMNGYAATNLGAGANGGTNEYAATGCAGSGQQC